MVEYERRLEALFAEYRTACGEPDGGPDFLPGIWSRIESRRRLVISMRRWTSAFAAAAAALCLAMTVYMAVPRANDPGFLSASYVDALGESVTFENVAYAEVADNGYDVGAGWR
jgi:hypothetical protein